MADGWRGAVQRLLRRCDEVLELRPPKRWTRENQRLGIAVGVTFVLTATAAICVIIGIARAIAPPSGCNQPECIQYMWQGRWAMLSFFATGIAVLTAIGTGVFVWRGVRETRDLKHLEFQAYIKARIGKFLAATDIIKVDVIIENQGRTKATQLMGSLNIITHSGDGLGEVPGPIWKMIHRTELFPGESENVGGEILTGVAPIEYWRNHGAHLVVEVTINYRTYFGSPDRIVTKMDFLVHTVPDGRLAIAPFVFP